MADRSSLTRAPDRIAQTVLGETVVETFARDSQHPGSQRFVAAGVVQRPYDVIALDFLQRTEDDRSLRLNRIFADGGSVAPPPIPMKPDPAEQSLPAAGSRKC